MAEGEIKAGRPTKYREEMCEQAETFLAEGYNRKALAAELDIHISTLVEWEKQNTNFSEAVKKGMGKSERWFMDQVRSGFFLLVPTIDVSCI